MLTIVTHHVPDLDAVASVWLLKRFLPNWQDAQVQFVPAGETWGGQLVDSDPNLLHVDTGFGILDHHQTNDYTCAAKKTYAYIQKKINAGNQDKSWSNEALERMIEVVNFHDHFLEATLPDARADYQLFAGIAIFDGLKSLYPQEDAKIVEVGFIILDAIYKNFQERIWAEEILEKEGIYFETPWGKGVAFESINDAVMKLAQKSGYIVVVRKDPKKGYVRIKGLPQTEVDFTSAYLKLQHLDQGATWYLHASKKILLNGSTHNPKMKPTKLSLDQIIEVLKK